MTRPVLIAFAATLSIFADSTAFAGEYGSEGGVVSARTSAEREIYRRTQNIKHANEALAAGNKALDEKDYEAAFAQFRLVLDILPPAPETAGLREEAKDGLCEAGVKLAEQRIQEGRHADAETLCRVILEDRYVPDCRPAQILLEHLNEPGYFNKTIGPRFVGNVEEVKKLLLEGKQYYQTGRFDLALKRYDQVLNIDPYNSAARKGQEQVNDAKSKYAIDAYNETRSRMIWEVDRRWESRVRNYEINKGARPDDLSANLPNNQALINKLNRIIIPQIQFRDATVREAIEFIKQKSVELDPDPDPNNRGVNIVLKLESSQAFTSSVDISAAPEEPGIPGLETAPVEVSVEAPAVSGINPTEARITLSLRQIPLMEALNYIANLAGLKVKVDTYAVAIVPQSDTGDVLVTKEYRVPSGFIPSSSSGDAGGGGGAFGGGTTAAVGNAADTGLLQRTAAKEFLEGNGVKFPSGATANFLPSSSRLIVRNTQDNIDLIDTLVIAGGQDTVPTQVEIESKFIEIGQNNTKELSFDWLLGQANIPGQSERTFFGGGTSGTSPAALPGDYPFNAGGTPVGSLPVTAGNRSGNLALTGNSINQLLAPFVGATNLAPGIFSLAGVFTDPQFQLVIRALNQKKGIDLLSAPRVTTRSGQRAVIEIVRELRYPTEFDPPQIPQTVGATGDVSEDPVTGLLTTSAATTPVTPTTPTAFESRNTGVSLEVEPVVGPDGYTIDLNLVPQVVEFDGFINYGSPILTNSINTLGVVSSTVVTPNTINQPVFSTRKVTTSVSIWDGQTVVMGGLIREDIQKVEDKTPLLGDIPILGRLFRSQVDQSFKRNLIIFVTARLIDSAGDAISRRDEEEDIIEIMAPPELEARPLPEAPLPMDKGK